VLIFTPETMQTYNKIFRLLLNLRRIQLNLNGLWKNLVVLNKPVLELRWNLQHVLIHLSQYIQIDVIEVQKSIMDRQIDQCQDFDKFRSAHANFLVVIAAQTFLHVPAVIDTYLSLA
jgi:gamma-tubulin complex component 4